ncbi:chemotaxis protein CheW [Pseudomonas sp. MAP12]|uniref:Chemotaxis protein CheW n=1 Tax=Geopseudomonas aromaticivorans TaxID=2849492 RepID=A0ABS6MZ52_9GAMM|nr:chemotaxis protein CheW [Pseudomonas aromaticivorans]MBV2134092.1 chemotaxis protein CheW [Pseudomonas aromaticivorans]
MNQAPAAGTTPQTLSSLLLPLTDRTLLVPSVALAELINQRPAEPRIGVPDWYLGDIIWRDLRLPLLSFETASSGTPPAAPAPGARIAVINALGGRPHLKFFALLVQGIPRPHKLDASLAPAGAPLAALELDSAQVEGGVARIPDLVGLEQKLADIGLI